MASGRKETYWRKESSIVIEMIKSFAFAGLELTMTAFNKAGKVPAKDKDPDNGNTLPQITLSND